MPSPPPTSQTWQNAWDDGRQAVAQQDWRKAQTHFTKACHLEPDFGAGHYNLAACLLETGAYAPALKALERAHAGGYDTPEVYYHRGVALLGLRRLAEGAQALRRAVARRPGYTAAYYELAEAQSRLGQHQQAEATALIHTALAPDSFEAHYALARTRTAQKAWLSAAAAFSASARLAPDKPEAALGVAVALTNGEAWAQALEAWEQYFLLSPNARKKVGLSLGLCHLGLDNFEAGEKAFNQAILADSQNADAYFFCGSCQLYARKWTQAAVSYRAGLALRPDDHSAQLSLGMALTELAQWSEAKAVFESAGPAEACQPAIDPYLLRIYEAQEERVQASIVGARLQKRRHAEASPIVD